MKNRLFSTSYILPLALACYLFISGCSVGAKVNISAAEMKYPASHTDSFYAPNDSLIVESQYEAVDDFSFTFTKWGVKSSLVEIKNEEDISSRLNRIIKDNNGDAIVNLKVSIHNPPGKNGLLWFTKTIAITSAALFTGITIIDPQSKYIFIAAGSTGLALFTPAAVDIKVEGTVVRLLE